MLSPVVHHVSLEIAPDDVERSAEFFELLGFERLPAPEALGPFVTWLWGERRAFALMPGGQRVELMAAPPPART
jgi:hypothetical protein